MGICAQHSKAMDAKDLRTETTIGERSSNGSSKIAQVGAAPPCSVNRTYENVSANPLAKLEAPTSRPCAVIGPDRIVPPSSGNAYSKKGHYEPWLHVDNTYRQPPEYPHKIQNYQSPIRNISPRQTFQENMQRIMVQPSYNSVKLNDDPNYTLDRNTTKSSKITGPHEAKYCDVPFSVNPISSEKPNEMCVTNMNSTRNYPQVWHPGSVGIRPTRPYGAPDLYQFSEYTSCAGPRPMPMPRPHRTMNEDPGHAYNETYYPEGNIRFKPYPTVKDRYPQPRYEYVSNYANPFHPPPFPSHKYDLQKPLPPHMTYPQIPIKYLENRMTDTIMDGYQRPQPVNYNVPYRNQVIHPTYGPMIGSNLQNKVYPYPLDGPVKSLASNKLPYDSKLYTEYENARNKGYPMSDNVYHMKNQPILPNYPTANMQPTHSHPYYRKESLAIRNYEYLSHLRHLDPSMNPNALTRLSTQFSPNSIAISPSDSNTSNETSHTHGGTLEDCGYVSQSSTTSIRSFDSGVNRTMPNDFYQRYNYPYQTMVRTSPLSSKLDGNGAAISSKDTKSIDVRQFLQTWNEGEEENSGKEKDVVNQSDFSSSKLANQYGAMKNHEQLYVLGLVNVPSEELGKYEHIQKISKLPENIKGYNNIELLKHFEEAIESSNINNPNHKQPTARNYHSSIKSSSIQGTGLLTPRPISPLDVEAKISQSVIHKEVGCNFEIKPCSPEMLNAEVATTAQSILGEERVIEKVSNPIIIKSPILNSTSESEKMCDAMIQKEHRIMLKDDINKTPSCKMIHTQCLNNEGVNVAKSNYSLQDLESNAGVCLASLPRLDNDIELTFPEVNQQFINANKESVIIANDYTTELEPMQNDDHYKTDENLITKSDNTSSVMPILDLEKEVSKLSKYRKIKRNEVEFKENQFLSISQSLRTDSVIIKNPENTKSLDKKSRTPPLVKEMNQTINHNLINSDPNCDNPVKNQTTDNINMYEDSNEMAIDFSLSRVEDKHSKYFSEMYSTRNPNSPPAKLPNDQQFLEDTNTASNLPSDSTNDITMKIAISDEVNDINLCPSSENIKKFNELDFEKLDITELDDVQHLNVVQEDKVVVECSEKVSEVNKETKNSDIVIVSKADLLIEKTQDEVTKKSIKPIKEKEKMDTSSIDINTLKKVEDTLFLSDSISGVYKVPEHNNDTSSNIQNKEDAHSSNDLYNNLDLKNNTPTLIKCKLTAVELDCTNDLQKVLSYNDTIKSVVTDESVLYKLIENRNCKIGSFVKQFSLNKELFSPQIQNLILSSEGHHSGLITSLQNKSKNFSVIESIRDVSIENNLNAFKKIENSQIQINFAHVKDHSIFDSEVDVLAVDNVSSNELRSVSTNVKDAELTTVDNRVNDCTNNELQSEPANVKNYVDSDLDAEVTAVDNSVNDFTNNKLKSESINVKDYSDSDFDAEFTTVDNSVEDCTNNDLQTESTNVKDYADSDLDPEVTSVENSVKDCTIDKLHSEPTNLTDYIDAEVTATDNSVKDCTNDKLQTQSTDGKVDYASSNKDADISAVDNIFQDFTNDILQSESDAQDTTVYHSVQVCVNDELQTESTNVQDHPDSGLDAQITSVDKSVKDGIKDDELQSDFTNDCPTPDADAEIFTADNLNNVTSFTNAELQPEATNLKGCPASDLGAEISNMDDLNSMKNFVGSKVQSNPDPNNFKRSSVFDSDVNASEDNLHNVEFTNSELKLTIDVKDCPILGSRVDSGNSVNVGVNSDLQSESIIFKDCKISNSNVKLSVVDSLNIVTECANSEPQSKTTDVNACPISDSDSDEDTSAVDNLNCEKGFAYSDIKLGSTTVNDCTISDSDVETSAVDSVKDLGYSGPTNPKDCQTYDSKLDITGVGSLHKGCSNNNLQSESNVNDYHIPDTYVENSYMNSNSMNDLAVYSKSFNCKESISHIVKSEIESGNNNNATCSTNDVSLDDNVAHLNQNINPDIKEMVIDNDAYTEVELIANDSGVHNIEKKESNVFDEQVTETNNLILHDSNICREPTSKKKLDQNTTINEDTETIMTSNTKGSLVRSSLKRSLSDSALFFYTNDKSENFLQEDIQLHNLITKRRRKNNEFINTCEPHFSTTEMLNNNNNRRNSTSSIYNEENMSFCIVIDNNCIITEENEEGDKLCYTEIPEECLTGIHTGNIDEDDVEPASEIILCPQENTNEYNEPLVLEISDEKSLEETWVDDVAYVETVVSDDIAEDIELSAPSSPTEIDELDNDESGIFTSVSEHTEKVKYIYGDKMCIDDAELVETLYRTPQMDVNKTLINRDSHITDDDDDECCKENPISNVSPELRGQETFVQTFNDFNTSESKRSDYNNTSNDPTEIIKKPISLGSENEIPTAENNKIKTTPFEVSQDNTINSCESSVDDVFIYNHDEYSTNCFVFSSPEVSSTTSEEKNASLLLKITNHQGTRTSQLNDSNLTKTNSCKFTENINYTNFISNSTEPRPLITKAAQKYIPPLKETVDDLKVKLPLPQDSLMKFKQLKMAKTGVRHNAVPKKDIPKKPKPKFEDVLKSLDDIQYKMHKEKRKKNKKPVPKVVIKKTENGSHYASTANRDCFNPDLTGRKWQPWVFIEKSSFIDKMALRRKTKAIYNHRKNTYVFADKFKKYKSMPNAKFVITQPKLDDTSVGKLKYTIRLKHSY